MNYYKVYNDIVSHARERQSTGYTERHHIIPRCMGGDDSLENIVRLTAREHYIAHWLLAKIYRDRKLVFAWRAMSMDPYGLRYTSHTFKYVREAWASAMSEINKGTVFSDDHRQKLRESHVGKVPWNKGVPMPLHKRYITARNAYYESPLPCKMCGEAIPYRMRTRKDRKYCSRRCYFSDPDARGWGRPTKANSGSFKPGNIIESDTRAKIAATLTGLKRPRGACPHCGKEGAISLLKRWHYDNCKVLKCL